MLVLTQPIRRMFLFTKISIARIRPVHRLAYNDDIAASQLAVF
jgi:hypothetical protein